MSSTKKLPKSDSIQKLAQFWVTHDLTDFEEQLEEVKEPVFERAAAVTVHLSTREAKAIDRLPPISMVEAASIQTSAASICRGSNVS